MKNKKYLVYTENYAFGGANRYMADYCNILSSRGGFDVSVWSNKGGVTAADRLVMEGVAAYREFSFASFHNDLFSGAGSLSFISRILKKVVAALSLVYNLLFFLILLFFEKPDVVHVFNGGLPGGLSCLSLVIASAFYRARTVLNIVSVPVLKEHYLVVRAYAIMAVRLADAVVVNSNAVRDELVNGFGISASKIFVIYNGIARPGCGDPLKFDSFCGASGARPPSAAVRIGCVGRFDELKGHKYLVDALKIVKAAGRDFSVLLVGKGPLKGSIEKMIEESGLGDMTRFVEFYPGDIEDALATCEIFVFPTLHEGFSYSLLEAMSAGCAIVTTDVCGNKEAIDDGVNGFCVPSRSGEALAEKVMRYLDDPGLMARHSKAAFGKLVNKFGMKAKALSVGRFLSALRVVKR